MSRSVLLLSKPYDQLCKIIISILYFALQVVCIVGMNVIMLMVDYIQGHDRCEKSIKLLCFVLKTHIFRTVATIYCMGGFDWSSSGTITKFDRMPFSSGLARYLK